MVRDKYKDENYFDRYIDQSCKRVEKFKSWILIGKTPEERIPIVKKGIGVTKLRIIIAKYSGGYSLSEIGSDYTRLLKCFSDYWPEGQVLMNHNGRVLKQYLDYDDMLWMLSFGILFDVSKEDFRVLSDLIKRDGVKDKFYECFISNKLGDNIFSGEESYEFGWDLYCSLREAIDEDVSEEEKIQFINKSLTSEWEKDHREMLNSLKGRHETYYGAWSFESAAIVAINGLDDSSFRGNEYYPKDLVDYYRSNHSV